MLKVVVISLLLNKHKICPSRDVMCVFKDRYCLNKLVNALFLFILHILDDIRVKSDVLVTLKVELAHPVHLSNHLNVVTSNKTQSMSQLDKSLDIGRRVKVDVVAIAAPAEQAPGHSVLDQAVVQVEVEEQLGRPQAQHVLLPKHPHHLPHRPLHLLRIQLPVHKGLATSSHFRFLLVFLTLSQLLFLVLTPQAITLEKVVLSQKTSPLVQRLERVEIADA